MIGGRAESAREWFNPPRPGRTVGVISRSGGMTSSCGYYLSRRGVGLSTLVHVGGDAVVGLPIPDVALQFQDDPETDAIVVFGEIGGSQEERLAELMSQKQVTKPVIAYIGGKAAREGHSLQPRRCHHRGWPRNPRREDGGAAAGGGDRGGGIRRSARRHPRGARAGRSPRGRTDAMTDAKTGLQAPWKTGITRVEPNRVAVRGYDIAELMGQVSFGATRLSHPAR